MAGHRHMCFRFGSAFWHFIVISSLIRAPLAFANDQERPAALESEFQSYLKSYPLKPVQDYTFLGTEQSTDKPIVTWEGRIEGWFDPAERVPWIEQAMRKGSFTVELVDGYLPLCITSIGGKALQILVR